MGDFYREREVKRVHKPRPCASCGCVIEKGGPALDCSGYGPDGFWAAKYHIECRKAECELNQAMGNSADEWFGLHEVEEVDDFEWLLREHPTVAVRLGIDQERVDRIKAKEQAYLDRARGVPDVN